MALSVGLFDSVCTPVYVYDRSLLDRTVETLAEVAFTHSVRVNYALKANCDETIVGRMAAAGFGADCVSGNEVLLANKCGFPSSSIFFCGAGKTDNEIMLALKLDIAAFVVESLQELDVLNELAGAFGRKARVMLRINPDIDPHTHKYITTGTARNKFGMEPSAFSVALERMSALENLEFVGLHMHIGSQIADCGFFGAESLKMNEMVEVAEKFGRKVRYVSLGGGLGVDYDNPELNPVPDFKTWLSVIDENLNRRPDQQVVIEPGRSLVAQCGTLIARVLYVKKGRNCNFLILDAGMNNLIRPALYGAHHLIENLSAKARGEKQTELYEVVGPVCESADVFASDCRLPVGRRGDLIAIRTAGAYGATMASRYNLKEIAESLYV